MTEEKILEEEILSDDELEDVAGGTRAEIQADANRLRGLGYLGSGKVTVEQINDAFLRLGRDYGLKLGYNPDKYDANRYYLNHDKKNHKQIWNIIYNATRGGGY